MLFELAAGLVLCFVLKHVWMTVVAPSDVTERDAEDIVLNKAQIQRSSSESAIKALIPNCTTLVVLFGWAGCKDRYLSKYANYYQESDLSTIRFTVPIGKVLGFPSYKSFARAFHKVLNEVLESTPISKIYFHVFSMNGCSLYAAYWDQLNKLEQGQRVKDLTHGIIFDSCPAFTSPSQSAHAVSFATLPPSNYPKALRGSYRAILFSFFSVQRGLVWLRSLVDKDVYNRQFAYFKMFTFDDLPKKQLCIYGPADLVCSEESIEDYMNEMEKRGISVSKLRLLDSLHCQHLRSHPTIYTKESLDFVKSGSLPENRSRVELEVSNLEDIDDRDVPQELAY